jgi:hypothetical protein
MRGGENSSPLRGQQTVIGNQPALAQRRFALFTEGEIIMSIAKASFLLSLVLPFVVAACSTQPNALDRMMGQAPDQQQPAAYNQGRRDQMQQERYYGTREQQYDRYGRPVPSGYGY